jgi:hypothetical protein
VSAPNYSVLCCSVHLNCNNFAEHLPKKLVEVAWDRVAKNWPIQYQRMAIASTLASKMVYQEGIHAVEHQADRDLADRAITWYRKHNEMEALALLMSKADMENVSEENKQLAINLVRRGGARTSMGIFI